MTERELARDLSPGERSCLKYLSDYPDAELHQFDAALVGHLESQGLIDRFLLVAFPVIPQAARYRLTEKGRSVLHMTLRGE